VPVAIVLEAHPYELSRSRFTALPIRLGRNQLNDCSVVHPMISSFHARIDDIGGKLCIEDLGSKNGVHILLPGAHAPVMLKPHEPCDLAPSGFQFFLGAQVRIKVTFEEIRDALDHRGAQSFSGSVVGNRGAMFGQPGPPLPIDPYGNPHASPHANPHLPPPQHGSGSFPAGPPAPAPAASAGYARGGAITQSFTMGPEVLALQGLRELAASLVPGTTLDTTGDVARFITKVHDALDAFLRSSIPLREGYSQFISSFDLQRNSYKRSAARSPAYAAVESANTPEALARALLDPNDRAFDGARALEGLFADLMLHQLALLEGVMRGVRALMEELSPQNIEQNTPGGGLSLGKHKARWETYVRRFEELYEERQTFAVIFGPEFTAAYRQYRQRSPGDVG
jgi:type VI secretion system protein ImpI